MQKFFAQWLLMAVVVFVSPATHAVLVPYHLVLQVTGTSADPGCGPPPLPEFHSFGCNIPIGSIFIGQFSVDDSLLAMEGDNLLGAIYNFRLQIGTVVWDQNNPGLGGSDFEGFRGPGPGCPIACVGASAPGFDVHGGVLTGLRGGVYGQGDNPFVDFPPLTLPGFFAAEDDQLTILFGPMIVGRAQIVPEPATLAILALGMAGLGFVRRRTVHG